ncbi:MAG: CocE/NonD family hydrolase [Spirochaetales bacterium]|nr:CocE/NonD family hydrolase [Spirochaetales bacterium]
MKKKTFYLNLVFVVISIFFSCKTHTIDGRFPLYSSQYLQMSDGTKIAVDTWMPYNMTADQKVPTLVQFTRYWRYVDTSLNLSMLTGERDFYLANGYSVVIADVRGTGASFGTWEAPWSPAEIQDTYEIIDWISKKEWSNGNVGTFGPSYLGTIQLLAASKKHPALKAIYPNICFYDLYRDLGLPGGGYNLKFIKNWNDFNRGLDLNSTKDLGLISIVMKSIRPVGDEAGKSELHLALKQHEDNIDLAEELDEYKYSDDLVESLGYGLDSISPHVVMDDIADSGVAVMFRDGWFDGLGANSALKTFYALPDNYFRVYLGPWSHMSGGYEKLFYSGKAEELNLSEESLRFFDTFLKGEGEAEQWGREINYYTLGEKRWKKTDVWPPRGFSDTKFYLSDSNTLAQESSQEFHADLYDIDIESTSAPFARYNLFAFPAGKAWKADFAQRDQTLLVYDSPILERDTEITGHPILDLYIKTNKANPMIRVYLEIISPKGKVQVISDGVLMAEHRKISQKPEGVVEFGPYHSFLSSDALAADTGKFEYYNFAMTPISVLVPAGYRLRVAISGADHGAFFQDKEALKGTQFELGRGGDLSSYVTIPIKN